MYKPNFLLFLLSIQMVTCIAKNKDMGVKQVHVSKGRTSSTQACSDSRAGGERKNGEVLSYEQARARLFDLVTGITQDDEHDKDKQQKRFDEVMGLMVKYSMSPNVTNPLPDSQGNCLLHYIARFFSYRQLDTFLKTFKGKLAVDVQNSQGLSPWMTVVHDAIAYEKKRAYKPAYYAKCKSTILITAGTNPNLKSRDGLTELQYALREGAIIIAQNMLCVPTIDFMDIKDKDGLSACEIAITSGFIGVLEKMLNHSNMTLSSKKRMLDFIKSILSKEDDVSKKKKYEKMARLLDKDITRHSR